MTSSNERRFRAMGSDAHVVLVGASEGLMDLAVKRIEQLEQRWSRFLPMSELSILNEAMGEVRRVSLDTIVLVQCAITAWRNTEGRFDPTMHDEIVGLGYDRTFDEVKEGTVKKTTPRSASVSLDDVQLDPERGYVTLPQGMHLDPGGIGKGLAAHLVSQWLLAHGANGAMVSLGGDVAVAGQAQHGDVWAIDVADPWDASKVIKTVVLETGGVATSSTLKRRWRPENSEADVHHLLDPSTHEPTANDVAAVTVVAGEAWWAEALTKSLLVSGGECSTPNAEAMVLKSDKSVTYLGEPEQINRIFRDPVSASKG